MVRIASSLKTFPLYLQVQLAIQTYELVDKHIRRLDSDLARFEGEIQDKTINARAKSEEIVPKSNILI